MQEVINAIIAAGPASSYLREKVRTSNNPLLKPVKLVTDTLPREAKFISENLRHDALDNNLTDQQKRTLRKKDMKQYPYYRFKDDELQLEQERIHRLAKEVFAKYPHAVKPYLICLHDEHSYLASIAVPGFSVRINIKKSIHYSDDAVKFFIAHECVELGRKCRSRYDMINDRYLREDSTNSIFGILNKIGNLQPADYARACDFICLALIHAATSKLSWTMFASIAALEIPAVVISAYLAKEIARSYDARRYEFKADDGAADIVGPQVAIRGLVELFNDASLDWKELFKPSSYLCTHPATSDRLERQVNRMIQGDVNEYKSMTACYWRNYQIAKHLGADFTTIEGFSGMHAGQKCQESIFAVSLSERFGILPEQAAEIAAKATKDAKKQGNADFKALDKSSLSKEDIISVRAYRALQKASLPSCRNSAQL